MDIFYFVSDNEKMNVATLKSYCEMKGLTQAKLAERTGISRQAISSWFKKAEKGPVIDVNVYSRNQDSLAVALGISVRELSLPLPVLSDPKHKKSIEVALLWDRLYPSIEKFIAGMTCGQPEALARLVQVYGLFAAEKIAGKLVWVRFPRYKNKIHPAVRRKIEVIWTHHGSRI